MRNRSKNEEKPQGNDSGESHSDDVAQWGDQVHPRCNPPEALPSPPLHMGVRDITYSGVDGYEIISQLTTVNLPDPAAFQVRVWSFGEPGFEIHRMQMSPVMITMPPIVTRPGSVTIAFVEWARGSYRFDDGPWHPMTGTAALFGATTRFTINLTAPSSFIMVSALRSEFRDRFDSDRLAEALSHSSHLIATRSYLSTIIDRISAGPDGSAPAVRTGVMQLLSDLLAHSHGEAGPQKFDAQVEAAVRRVAADPASTLRPSRISCICHCGRYSGACKAKSRIP